MESIVVEALFEVRDSDFWGHAAAFLGLGGVFEVFVSYFAV